VRICDVVAEGFSPGVLQRLGLGYDVMKSIRPDIIYIQQSGMGARTALTGGCARSAR
jgi:crotonobetainyl-CoA:carnitine CoA-transferase CaiB-like acyl-CoA transferase